MILKLIPLHTFWHQIHISIEGMTLNSLPVQLLEADKEKGWFLQNHFHEDLKHASISLVYVKKREYIPLCAYT